jgi:hypothetical protein
MFFMFFVRRVLIEGGWDIFKILKD